MHDTAFQHSYMFRHVCAILGESIAKIKIC